MLVSALALFAGGSIWLVLYPPILADLGGADDLERSFTRIEAPLPDGDRVAAWLHLGRRGAPLVVMLPGYGRDPRRLSRYVRALGGGGASLLAIEFRSARPDRREPTTLGAHELEDARAVLAWARAEPRLSGAPPVLFGESLGASVALVLAAGDSAVAGVIADSPFASGRDALEDGFRRRLGIPAWPLAPALRAAVRAVSRHDPYALDALSALSALGSRPVLLIQPAKGDRFSLRQVEALERAAGPGVTRWTLEDAGHCQAWVVHRAEYERKVAVFLAGVRAASRTPHPRSAA